MSTTSTTSIRVRADRARVTFATVIGTTVEWYDYFVYATIAGLVFGKAFFEPAGEDFASIVSFASVGLSFLFRPFGAFLAGHLGDRFGRRVVLVATLLVMGLATALIGVLPTYAQIGILAPVLVLLLRCLQGISAGGEWGGAVLMSVEHAPTAKRGAFGAAPQIGVPAGSLLASAVLALMTGVISPGDAFYEWGWRVPFLLSVVLIAVGYFVRRSVDESPVFAEIAKRQAQTKAPLGRLLRHFTPLVLLAALTFAGMNATGYLTTGGFIQKYSTESVGMDPTPVMLAVAGAAATQLAFTWLSGVLSDRIGRRTTYLIGWVALLVTLVALFPLVQTGNPMLMFLGLAIMTVGLGMTYGPQAAWFSELFPASVRFSGVSIAYAVGSILGGAFSPLISQALLQATHSTWSIVIYLGIMIVVSFVATLLLRDRSGIPLGMDHEQEQSVSPIYGARSARAGRHAEPEPAARA